MHPCLTGETLRHHHGHPSIDDRLQSPPLCQSNRPAYPTATVSPLSALTLMLESNHTSRGWRLTALGQPACCDGHNTVVQRTRDNLVDGSRMGHQGGRDPKLYLGEEDLCGNAKGSLIPFDGRSECSRGLWGMSMDECLSGNENEGVAPYEGERTSRATTHNGTCSHRRARHRRGNRYDTSSGLPKFWKNLRWFGVRFQNFHLETVLDGTRLHICYICASTIDFTLVPWLEQGSWL